MTDAALTVFADYVCPYCYLAEVGVAELRAAGVAVEAAAFELRPAGTPLPVPDAPWLREAWDRVVTPLATRMGVRMQRPAFATRTRKAHEAVAFARQEGALSALHSAIYRAFWQEGRDIGRIDVLVEIGAEVGLDRGALRVALDIDQWTERVAQDAAWGRQLGLSAVPAYLLRQSGGADSLPVVGELRTGLQFREELEAWVMSNDV